MKKLVLLLLAVSSAVYAGAQSERQPSVYERSWKSVATGMPDSWYGSAESIDIAENILFYQRKEGGWPKNIPMHRPLTDEQRAELTAEVKPARSVFADTTDPTIDNDATITEMRFMAKMYAATGDKRYRESFERGLDYLLAAQYDNGGWPQFYPSRGGYYTHITYNDNAMVNVMSMLRDIFNKKPEYGFVANRRVVKKARESFYKGVDCILKSQIMVDGKPTVWCAQHDEVTLEPAQARSYELPSFSGSESVGIVMLLMAIPQPSPEITRAIKGAVEWFEANKIEGIRIGYETDGDGLRNRVVVEDPSAPAIWARFYDLETGKPFFCSRDGIKRATMAEISHERRNGYSWYTNAPQRVLDAYYSK